MYMKAKGNDDHCNHFLRGVLFAKIYLSFAVVLVALFATPEQQVVDIHTDKHTHTITHM